MWYIKSDLTQPQNNNKKKSTNSKLNHSHIIITTVIMTIIIMIIALNTYTNKYICYVLAARNSIQLFG